MSTRSLHYVFKIANRQKTIDFYTKTLGMKILRHEEFEKGCEATCNGPFDGCWSKTMIGYGNEDDHFVIELTYNYPIHQYDQGNHFKAIIIDSDEIYNKVLEIPHEKTKNCGRLRVSDPDGHSFKIRKGEGTKISNVQIHVSNLEKSTEYYRDILGMSTISQTSTSTKLTFSAAENQCILELSKLEKPINRGNAFGRIAFSYPGSKLLELQGKVKSSGFTIINEMITLQTPGKADVQVVILADPDNHEICFVGDEGFRDLSKVDPKATELLEKHMKTDDSEKWY
ncbi:unnamed protein product [Caenorhabditis angaria]|uniref:VOC domain-containing protein n=1 Tax=Caenorhabditis angaria TaxID=860376 RepID=A0A9P1N2T6_9PELO|nr:unnamed protein product [Caenorhabditis angaria]